LPVEREDFDLVLPTPGFVVSGRKDTGQVLLLNSRSGQEHDAPRHNYTSKYGKLTYSTHFPFNVIPSRGSYAPDAMISLTHDGQAFGHRLHTRNGEVAPGFMWCKFEQLIDDELQPLWTAVLLWRDVQIRLTVIRPTFPVMAFEAPGTLGCEKPTNIIRRSDPAAGWEYADAQDCAIAIQRLIGYDSQRVSAPFLDQSNINLAYTYSEQPVVHESEVSVAARCLATAALVRPGPFEPTQEFGGIKVEIESPEIFHVTLPDNRSAIVAPGETTPKRINMNGIEFTGTRMRYAQMTTELNEICGLGITSIADIASFSSPATFRLTRASNGAVGVTTNAGISLADQWLGEKIRCIEARTLNHQWMDVTEQCQSGSIPTQLVQEWSDRNQRTLVDFRINA
jgi:hypothetical protein